MMNFADSTFEDSTIALDGARYTDCTFLRCQLVYGGGVLQLQGNTFDTCLFVFKGPAALTLEFMRGCAEDPGLAAMIEQSTGFKFVGVRRTIN